MSDRRSPLIFRQMTSSPMKEYQALEVTPATKFKKSKKTKRKSKVNKKSKSQSRRG